MRAVCFRRAFALHGFSSAALRPAPFVAAVRAASSSSGADRLKVLGSDAAKPTLEIEPFGKSQRLGRPIAPHLTIYQPQLTWVMSGSFRVLSVAMAAGFYAVAIPFALMPASSAAIAAYVHAFPAAVVFLAKLVVATPFTFHFYNGIRHLLWDTGNLLSVKNVYNTGYAVLGLTAVTSIILAFL